MTAVEQVITWLLANSGVTSLVGERIRPVILAEDDAMPAITVHTIIDSPYNSLSSAADVDHVSVMVNYWSTTYAEVQLVKAAGRACLHGNGIVMNDETEDYDSGLRQYRVSQQWSVFV